MLFALMLGLVLGGAGVLLLEQWLRGELRTLTGPAGRSPARARLGIAAAPRRSIRSL